MGRAMADTTVTTTDTATATVVKKKTVHTTPQPILPKRDEGVLLEIMRNFGIDLKSLADAVNLLNAHLEAQNANSDKILIRSLIKQLQETNAKLIEAQSTTLKDYAKWAMWITTCALLGAGVIKLYTGWP